MPERRVYARRLRVDAAFSRVSHAETDPELEPDSDTDPDTDSAYQPADSFTL